MELIEDGTPPVEAFMEALANDEHPEFRQIALLPAQGEPLIHSGKNIKPASGHMNGDNCIAVGNFLANDRVLPAIIDGFANTSTEADLAERIISALEAAKQAGGQAGTDGTHLPERSAALLIGAPGERFPIDIRVDASTDAIAELRTTYDTYLPMHEFYLKRADNPTDLPSQDDWVNGLR